MNTLTPRIKQEILNTIDHYLPDYDPRLIAAQIRQESEFDPCARSPVGAMGLMQIMPATWADETHDFTGGELDPDYGPHNICVGMRYMAKMLKGWTAPRPEIDRICLALASYNAGFGNLLKAQKATGRITNDYASIIAALPQVTGHHAKETTQYVERIFGYYNEYVIKGW